MRHAGEIDDHRLAADGLAETEADARLGLLEIFRREQLAQVDGLALGVGQLDADGVLAGDDGDAAGDGTHRAGDVVGKTDDARRLDARRRLQFVEGDHRAGTDVDDLAADAEIVEHAFEQPGVLLERGLADGGGLLVHLGLAEECDRRQNETALRGRLAGFADCPAAGLGFGGWRRNAVGLDRLAEILFADRFADIIRAGGPGVVIEAAETGLDPHVAERAGRPVDGVVGTAADDEAADHADEAERQMGGEADDQSEARRALVLVLFVVVLLHHGGDVIVVVQILIDLRFGGNRAGNRPDRRDRVLLVVGHDRSNEAAGVEHQSDGGGGDHDAGDECA